MTETPADRSMTVAPYEACVVCFKGDTTTVLAFAGEPEWHAAGLIALGIPEEQALALAMGPAPPTDHLRDGTPVWAARVCRECAERSPFASALGRVGELVRPISLEEKR